MPSRPKPFARQNALRDAPSTAFWEITPVKSGSRQVDEKRPLLIFARSDPP
jgi:hypothetical protein